MEKAISVQFIGYSFAIFIALSAFAFFIAKHILFLHFLSNGFFFPFSLIDLYFEPFCLNLSDSSSDRSSTCQLPNPKWSSSLKQQDCCQSKIADLLDWRQSDRFDCLPSSHMHQRHVTSWNIKKVLKQFDLL